MSKDGAEIATRAGRTASSATRATFATGRATGEAANARRTTPARCEAATVLVARRADSREGATTSVEAASIERAGPTTTAAGALTRIARSAPLRAGGPSAASTASARAISLAAGGGNDADGRTSGDCAKVRATSTPRWAAATV